MSTILGKHFNTNLCLYGIINEELMKQFRFTEFEEKHLTSWKEGGDGRGIGEGI